MNSNLSSSFGNGGALHVDTEHRPKPDIFADALVHHVLVHTAPASIGRVGAHGQILVSEHAPGANHLDALGLVSLNQKLVSHRFNLALLVPSRGPRIDSRSALNHYKLANENGRSNWVEY